MIHNLFSVPIYLEKLNLDNKKLNYFINSND